MQRLNKLHSLRKHISRTIMIKLSRRLIST